MCLFVCLSSSCSSALGPRAAHHEIGPPARPPTLHPLLLPASSPFVFILTARADQLAAQHNTVKYSTVRALPASGSFSGALLVTPHTGQSRDADAMERHCLSIIIFNHVFFFLPAYLLSRGIVTRVSGLKNCNHAILTHNRTNKLIVTSSCRSRLIGRSHT